MDILYYLTFLLSDNQRLVWQMNSRASCIRYTITATGSGAGLREVKLLPVLDRFGLPGGLSSSAAISGSGATTTVTWDTGLLAHTGLFSPMRIGTVQLFLSMFSVLFSVFFWNFF